MNKRKLQKLKENIKIVIIMIKPNPCDKAFQAYKKCLYYFFN